MKFIRLVSLLLRKPPLPRNVCNFHPYSKCIPQTTRLTPKDPKLPSSAGIHDTNDSDSDLEDLPVLDEDYADIIQHQPATVKHLLYPNSKDAFISSLNECASVVEVFERLKTFEGSLRPEHLTQAVLVLWDLQKMFYHVNVTSEVSNLNLDGLSTLGTEYKAKLNKYKDFLILVERIKEKVNEFPLDDLGCLILFLNKMGLTEGHELMQLLMAQLVKRVESGEFSWRAVANFMETAFRDGNLRAYFLTQNVLPQIYKNIDKCRSSEDFTFLTTCFNSVYSVLPFDIFSKYKTKFKELLKNGVIKQTDYKTILKVSMFLNYPTWRHGNSDLLVSNLRLLKDNFSSFNVSEILNLYEIFYKNQEPADVLTDLQRTASRLMVKLGDETTPLLEIRLKLLIAIICFSSPINRPQIKSLVNKFFDNPIPRNAILDMNKILVYMKIYDEKISSIYWNTVLESLLKDREFREDNLLKITMNYLLYYDAAKSRHSHMEVKLNAWLKAFLQSDYRSLIPNKFSTISCFYIVFGRDEQLMKEIATKIQEISNQLSPLDVFNLSKSLHIQDYGKFASYYSKIRTALAQRIANTQIGKINANDANLYLKSCIYLGNATDETLMKYFESFSLDEVTSKFVKNFTYCMQSTDLFYPRVLDRMVDYLVGNKERIMAFNAEKLVYACYYFAHRPKNSEAFFIAVTDIIIRDQARISGLTYLQACLALCYFQRLPESFIKQIFNVQFLEKLDSELTHCYYKDVYPLRVRHKMMQLNRAVCLDYPECNVPWFHQKYTEETKIKTWKEPEDYDFIDNVKRYLSIIVEKEYLQQFITPYGYFVDFVIGRGTNRDFVHPDSEDCVSKIAVLLLRPGTFSKVIVQLKGQYRLKIRHLQILGYKTVLVNYLDWRKMATGTDKINYLKHLLRLDELNPHIREDVIS